MTTAMGRIEASAQVEPLPVLHSFFGVAPRRGPNSAPPPWPSGQPGWGAARGAPRYGHGRASARLPPSLHHHAAAMPPPLALAHGHIEESTTTRAKAYGTGGRVPPWRPPRGSNDARVGRVGGWPFPEGKCVLGYWYSIPLSF